MLIHSIETISRESVFLTIWIICEYQNMKQNVQVFLPSPKRGFKQMGLSGTEAKMEHLHNEIFTGGTVWGKQH